MQKNIVDTKKHYNEFIITNKECYLYDVKYN